MSYERELATRRVEIHNLSKNLATAYVRHYGTVPDWVMEIVDYTSFVLKYDPDQPRVPAGNPDGGQWTSEGSGEGDGSHVLDTVDVSATGHTIQSGLETTPDQGNAKPAAELSTSSAGINFIAQHEGFKPYQYLDTAGRPTIGFGHLLQSSESYPDGITWNEATQLLAQDINTAETAVQNEVTAPLTQNQFDALTSFTYNEGTGALGRSTLLQLLNQGDYSGAADQFLVWNKIRSGDGQLVPDPGLTSRRNDERNLFLNGIY